MNVLSRLGLAAALALSALCAHAESLQCGGRIAAEGDSRIAVLYKCGPPLLQDSHCAPVYLRGALEPVPEAIGNAYVPCQPVEEWLYDRGPGSMTATVRFRWGVVQSISYGREPR